MGCHTSFSRPITDKEFQLMKEYALIEIFDLTGPSAENIELGLNNEFLYKQLTKSFVEMFHVYMGSIGGNSAMVQEIQNY